jgi:protease I
MQMAGQLTGKKVVIIVAQEFEDIELLYPVLRLNEEGAEIVVVPVNEGLHPRPYIEGKPVTGRFGHPVPIPVMAEGNRYRVSSIEELNAVEIDCLLFPGGYSPDALRLHTETLELVRECHRRGKLLTAICHGPWVLISAGVMEGKQATGYVAVRDDLVNARAEFVDVPAVRDGNIITGRVPDDLPEFCQEIIKALSA